MPHTDESFWNRDLGNCLDYTNNFEGNKSPDQGLYEYLANLYGSIDGSISAGYRNQDVGADTEAPVADGSRRRLSSSKSGQRVLFHDVADKLKRQTLLSKWYEIDEIVNSSNRRKLIEQSGWRLLHENQYSEAHEIDLGDDYKVQVHMLRP